MNNPNEFYYRIKKHYHFDSDGKSEEIFYCQRKIPILNWVYFQSMSNLPMSRSWFGVMTLIMFVVVIILFISTLLIIKKPEDHSNFALFYFSIIYTIIFLICVPIAYKTIGFSGYGEKSEQAAKDLIQRRIDYRLKRKAKAEIIEVSITVERARKLEHINNL